MSIDPTPLSPAATHAVALLAWLSAAFAIKHLVADFLVQTNAMARGKERATGWFLPLLRHVLCHMALTAIILLAVAPRLWWLALVDFAVHFTIDRGKALVAQRGGWKPDQPQFWWLLGLDQCLHHVTNIALATTIVLL